MRIVRAVALLSVLSTVAFAQAPFGIPSGWSTYPQSISEEIQSIR